MLKRYVFNVCDIQHEKCLKIKHNINAFKNNNLGFIRVGIFF